jgi:O-succinylbenzoic acid--CoA ligase
LVSVRWSAESTITEVLDHVLDRDPGREALSASSGSLTYHDLDDRANAAAAALHEVGVRRGDRVAACLPNDLDIVVAFHGAMRLGAVWVGLNPRLAPADRRALLAMATPSVVLLDGTSDDDLDADAPVLRVDPRDTTAEWGPALDAYSGAARPPLPDVEAPAAIVFTSGTTGSPKGVVHSQRNLLLPAASMVTSRRYDETLRKGDCLTLTIQSVLVLTTLLTSTAGGCCLITDRRDGPALAQWIARERINLWYGVPAQLSSMAHDPNFDPELLASLREVWTGGSACRDSIVGAFEARFRVPVRVTYGLTEAPSIVTIDPVDGPHVDGASGVPLPHLDVSVRDEEGRPCPPGQEGEVVIGAVADGPWAGAYAPMLGHWRADGTVDPYPYRELRTGDIAVQDENSYLSFRDRQALLVGRNGVSVSPARIERFLDQAPGVRTSAVLAVPDDFGGHRLVAAIETTPDFTDVASILSYCRAGLDRSEVPDDVVVLDALPRNDMGKVELAALVGRFHRSR